jgi:lipoprotein signal peptidase
VAAGVGAGGAVGNALSALVFSGGVPDPLLLTRGGSYLAFNLADVLALCSAVGLLSAAAAYALRHQGALFERL